MNIYCSNGAHSRVWLQYFVTLHVVLVSSLHYSALFQSPHSTLFLTAIPSQNTVFCILPHFFCSVLSFHIWEKIVNFVFHIQGERQWSSFNLHVKIQFRCSRHWPFSRWHLAWESVWLRYRDLSVSLMFFWMVLILE